MLWTANGTGHTANACLHRRARHRARLCREARVARHHFGGPDDRYPIGGDAYSAVCCILDLVALGRLLHRRRYYLRISAVLTAGALTLSGGPFDAGQLTSRPTPSGGAVQRWMPE